MGRHLDDAYKLKEMKMTYKNDFLPINKDEMLARGWHHVDFVLVTADAYVDHPSFGAAVLARVLAAEGYRVGILPQPSVDSHTSFEQFGRPRLAFLISGGVVDSMVAHYTVAKRRRTFDEYTPSGKVGKRPDRAVEVYTQLAKKAFADVPVVIGGIEASLRRFSHYDYWSDEVRFSILQTSGADMISFGMGERSIREIAKWLCEGQDISEIRDVAGTAYMCDFDALPQQYAECAAHSKVSADKAAYAKACALQMDNQDPLTAKPIVQRQKERYLVQNIPAMPLSTQELDAVYALPFTRRWHPMYDAQGGVPALEEVEFSIAHNRGCFGGCNFCAITLHQGRSVTSRSGGSILKEAQMLTKMPGFKGYIHDVGGPTANFRAPSCEKQKKHGLCKNGKRCLVPGPCAQLSVDHSEYMEILQKIREIPSVKKVFIRSGIRYDYLVYDKDERFFKQLVEHHVSGQLKVAPEHCSKNVLSAMGKPPISTYNRFARRFEALSKQAGKNQYLVPYLMSSHPGSTLKDAVELAEYLSKQNIRPQQVQDFYPTPGTVSTCMYYTGLNPLDQSPVHVPRTSEEKAIQRALLQYYLPQNAAVVRSALRKVHREDLISVILQKSGDRRKAQGSYEDKKNSGAKGKEGRGGKQKNSLSKHKNAQGKLKKPKS